MLPLQPRPAEGGCWGRCSGRSARESPGDRARESDRLSEALEIDLELEAAEHAVGVYALDLVGRDLTNDDRIAVVVSVTSTKSSAQQGISQRRAQWPLPFCCHSDPIVYH
jgi:hypothetical protein